MTYYPLLSNSKNCIILNKALYHSPKLFHFIISTYETLEDIQENIPQLLQNFKIKKTDHLLTLTKQNISKEESYIKNKNIKLLTLNDPNYPQDLKEIPYPPPVLFYKGNTNILKKPMIAIVGPRKPSDYGKSVTTFFTKSLSQHFTIVSGFAAGIDTLAHQTCLETSGSTIAVMGVGLDKCYPYTNQELAQKILKQNSLLLSEIPLFNKPEKYHFPLRNRIISGLSKGVLIVEANEKSGSLLTANYALDQNREVFAVPGNITQDTSKGVNHLIKLGAKCTTEPSDIFDELHIKTSSLSTEQHTLPFAAVPKEHKIPDVSPEEKKILSLLKSSKHIDDIINESGLPIYEVLHKLTRLEVNNHIKKTTNNSYILTH